MNEQLYRIYWRSKRTGATGYMADLLPKHDAEKYAKELNDEPDGYINWIEPAPQDEQPESEAKQ